MGDYIVDLYDGVFKKHNFNVTANKVMQSTFKQYLENGYHPFIGKRGFFERPESATEALVQKVHLLKNEDLDAECNKGRTYGERTSDRYLIFAQNLDNHKHYLLIGILPPSAHKNSEDLSFMRDIIGIARLHFRNF